MKNENKQEVNNEEVALEEKLKKQHGDVHKITVNFRHTEEKITVYFREPELDELDMFLALQSQGKTLSGGQVLARMICIGGDKRAIEDSVTFRGVFPKITLIFGASESELKKL